jgi:hypothetical protein
MVNGMKVAIRYILNELDGLERKSTDSAKVRGLTDLVSSPEATSHHQQSTAS